MSKDLIAVIGRAIEDDAFRQLLLSNPEEACKNSNLTNEERLVLKSLDESNFDDFVEGLSRLATAMYRRQSAATLWGQGTVYGTLHFQDQAALGDASLAGEEGPGDGPKD